MRRVGGINSPVKFGKSSRAAQGTYSEFEVIKMIRIPQIGRGKTKKARSVVD
jgi:hypothetical protein